MQELCFLVLPVDEQEDQEGERERIEAAARKILQDFEGLWAGSYEYPPPIFPRIQLIGSSGTAKLLRRSRRARLL